MSGKYTLPIDMSQLADATQIYVNRQFRDVDCRCIDPQQVRYDQRRGNKNKKHYNWPAKFMTQTFSIDMNRLVGEDGPRNFRQLVEAACAVLKTKIDGYAAEFGWDAFVCQGVSPSSFVDRNGFRITLLLWWDYLHDGTMPSD
jgi:hypothetical protein